MKVENLKETVKNLSQKDKEKLSKKAREFFTSNKHFKVKGRKLPKEEAKKVIKGVTKHIKTKEPQKILSGKAFTKKIAEKLAAKKAGKTIAKKVGKKLLSSLPIVGTLVGVGSAIASGDVSAALPTGAEVEAAGPKKGSPSAVLEDPRSSKAEREAARKILIKRRKAREGK